MNNEEAANELKCYHCVDAVEGHSLDSGYDWIEDIAAWMPLPEPYKEDKE